jgi:hypothetical protein
MFDAKVEGREQKAEVRGKVTDYQKRQAFK